MKKFALMLFQAVWMTTFSQTTFDIEGHRGARGLYPENTVIAFIEALKLGVNTLEMDVVVSKDNQLVVSHEPWMNADICTDLNSKKLTGDVKQNHNLYRMTYANIKSYNCGSIGNPNFPQQQKIVAHKPLLSEVIDTVEKYIAANKLAAVWYNIEIKSTPDGDDKFHPKPAVFAKLLYNTLKQKGILNRCIIQSFDVRSLQEVHRIDTSATTALLIADANTFEQNIAQLGFTPSIYSPNHLLVDKKLVEKCHAKGIRIIPWTVNDEKKMKALKKMGVDGIITDYPDVAIKVLR